MNTSSLIDALLNPSTYKHNVEVITTIETHISIVFLTGEFAYKLKKPVNFGFLDFSSLASRKKFCQLELQLNQRTAPQLYLGVMALVKKTNDSNSNIEIIALDQADENPTLEVIDYVVKMRQFDPNGVLGRLLDKQELDENTVEQIVSKIVGLHQQAEAVAMDSYLGEPETQLKPMVDNFPSLKDYCKDPITSKQLSEIESWTHERFAALKPAIQLRKQNGFVRACHGDLHLDNITLFEENGVVEPLLFDGIEFNDSFRWIDVISDLAFLLIDLEFRGKLGTSSQCLSLYLSRTLDYNSLQLLNFYRSYRAMVRAKITGLRAMQLGVDSLEQKQVLNLAKNYVHQAHCYTQVNSPVKCILLQGISGSGKSHFANQMLKQLPGFEAIVISSDRIRKTLFGLEPHQRVDDQQKSKLYSAEMNQKTYHAMLQYAQTCMQNGFNVIVDATFLKQAHRYKFVNLCAKLKQEFYLIYIKTDREQAGFAIEQRLHLNNNPSDADAVVMQNQLRYLQEPSGAEALWLHAKQLRQFFPQQAVQEYLNLADID
ncbi:AAA family ATPase [Thiomicrorhabdus sediminis]|uniref:Aminoglycoside phosphotransferase domain-containing protein n=1 Tax=Thiomicrorhabdus sediminis TaxID=2580412 RepID=A0A4V1HHT6_9GAMM|nr:bifunctional aminoglycoside phosphotransferase/ATP-binding protein [Thiomicrorhabdus sediminis]QCU90153.1 hypothetical protein FE785_05685 [Thiomicrorhabdus sediminis]